MPTCMHAMVHNKHEERKKIICIIPTVGKALTELDVENACVSVEVVYQYTSVLVSLVT